MALNHLSAFNHIRNAQCKQTVLGKVFHHCQYVVTTYGIYLVYCAYSKATCPISRHIFRYYEGLTKSCDSFGRTALDVKPNVFLVANILISYLNYSFSR